MDMLENGYIKGKKIRKSKEMKSIWIVKEGIVEQTF